MGIAIIDPITAEAYTSGGLLIRRLKPVNSYDLKLTYPAKQPRSELVRAFVEIVTQKLERL
tara:strand:+ start:821 stop:1003 length:183 start_codon:yes stop_codon:yes gene_type:complete